jgi:uncharacterized membrane-anchored protein YitT (DUF2179 family)
VNIKNIRTYIILTFGLFINAFAWAAFLIPSKIVGGGVSGIGLLIYYSTGIPVGVFFLGANVIFLLVAVKTLGSRFGAKTIYGIIMLSLFLSVLQKLIPNALVKDAFMATLIGGALGGTGIGIAFSQGGSTGGTDIIAMIINKYRNISPGKVILTIDIFIIGSSFLVFHSIEKIIYGFVCMAVATYSIDLFLNGSRESLQVTIISKKYADIANKIGKDMNRGVTLLNGKGWYSNEDIEVIMTMIHKSQSAEIMRLVQETDDKAFVSMARVMGVYGKGFEQLRY